MSLFCCIVIFENGYAAQSLITDSVCHSNQKSLLQVYHIYVDTSVVPPTTDTYSLTFLCNSSSLGKFFIVSLNNWPTRRYKLSNAFNSPIYNFFFQRISGKVYLRLICRDWYSEPFLKAQVYSLKDYSILSDELIHIIQVLLSQIQLHL